MLHRKTKLIVLQPRPIYRKWLKHVLLVSATLSIMVAGCTPRPPLRTNQEQMLSAIFYQDAQQCKADIQQQQQNYQTQLKAYQQGSITQSPIPPVLKVANCDPQMQAAIAEHNRHAPVYASLEDCQSEGIQCERTPANVTPSGYRPVFGGAYIYPYGNSTQQRTSIIYGGTSYGIYRPYTVYRSLTPGNLVTPFGQTITQTTSGKVTVPSYTSLVAPERPKGTTAKGTIKGRNNTGFGSTYKSTGKGGK